MPRCTVVRSGVHAAVDGIHAAVVVGVGRRIVVQRDRGHAAVDGEGAGPVVSVRVGDVVDGGGVLFWSKRRALFHLFSHRLLGGVRAARALAGGAEASRGFRRQPCAGWGRETGAAPPPKHATRLSTLHAALTGGAIELIEVDLLDAAVLGGVPRQPVVRPRQAKPHLLRRAGPWEARTR